MTGWFHHCDQCTYESMTSQGQIAMQIVFWILHFTWTNTKSSLFIYNCLSSSWDTQHDVCLPYVWLFLCLNINFIKSNLGREGVGSVQVPERNYIQVVRLRVKVPPNDSEELPGDMELYDIFRGNTIRLQFHLQVPCIWRSTRGDWQELRFLMCWAEHWHDDQCDEGTDQLRYHQLQQ